MALVTRKVDDRSRVVLPEAFTGRMVSVETMGPDEVRIRVIKPARVRPKLSDLLSQMTAENRHDAIDFGPPVGNEST